MIIEPPTEEHVLAVCRPGQEALTCRYLTMSPFGWSCEKHSALGRQLDRRAAAGDMIARADNCEGRASR